MSCVQKIGTAYLQDIKYECNKVSIKVQGVTHSLDYLLSFSDNSCILSNNISTFELYTPGVDIEKVKDCFNCTKSVKLENIEELKGLGNIINSFNSNSNNSNSIVGNSNALNNCSQPTVLDFENKELKEQLDRIESEVKVRNYGEQSFLPFVIIICLALIVVILFIAKNL